DARRRIACRSATEARRPRGEARAAMARRAPRAARARAPRFTPRAVAAAHAIGVREGVSRIGATQTPARRPRAADSGAGERLVSLPLSRAERRGAATVDRPADRTGVVVKLVS